MIMTKILGADPKAIFPNPLAKEMCFIKNVIKSPNIIVGDYSYYSDWQDSARFEKHCVLFHSPELKDKLIIGKFCQLASGIKFIMNGANHRMHGVSTYPFSAVGGGWEEITPHYLEEAPVKGDTVLGNDIWIGMNSTIMPGIKIGDGAIIATNSTVVKDVEPYTIYGGNPAKFIKKRFDDEMTQLLLTFKWWDLPPAQLSEILPVLCGADLEKIRSLMKQKFLV